MPELTVIIPTYNRLEMLKQILSAYNDQTYDLRKVEILVFDDYSDINPEKEILKMSTCYKLRFFKMGKNSGQGKVRNSAIKLAKGKYLFFTGDDMIPEKNLLEEHMKLHQKHEKIAVLGKVKWKDDIRNEFMNFIEKIQFHYDTIKDKTNVKFHFYTSNISLEKEWFDNETYSEKFENYGLEDLELGYRLEKKGLRVVYNEKAIVYHNHPYTFEKFCNRMKNVGKSAVIFAQLHPELKKKYISPFIPFYRLICKFFSYGFTKKINKKFYWYASFVHNYIVGLEEGMKLQEEEKAQILKN